MERFCSFSFSSIRLTCQEASFIPPGSSRDLNRFLSIHFWHSIFHFLFCNFAMEPVPDVIVAVANDPLKVNFTKIGVLARLEASLLSHEWERCIVALSGNRKCIYTFAKCVKSLSKPFDLFNIHSESILSLFCAVAKTLIPSSCSERRSGLTSSV